MKKLLTCVVFLLFTGFGLNVFAQEGETEPSKDKRAASHAEMRAQLGNMTEEERAAKRAEMRARFESMTEEERAAMKAERKARLESMTDEERAAEHAKMRERWESMSEEERAAIREQRMQGGEGHKGKKHKMRHKARKSSQDQAENPG